MRIAKTFLRTGALFFLLFCNSVTAKVPDANSIRKAHKQIVRKYWHKKSPNHKKRIIKKTPQHSTDRTVNIRSFLKRFGTVLIIAIILIFIGALIYILKKTGGTFKRSLFPQVKKKRQKKPNREREQYHKKNWYQLANKEKAAGNFSTAAIFLYFAFVKRLQKKAIIQEEHKLTNNEIRNKLRNDKKKQNTFHMLATTAELIVFGHETIDLTQYNALYKNYCDCFYIKETT